MITLHKLNGDEFILNSNQIEVIEEKPHTVITLSNEKKYLVKESSEEIIKKIIQFHGRVRILKREDHEQ